MRALLRDGGVRLASQAAPRPRVGEVLVSVRSAGICRTDVYVADGRLAVREPRVLGHEAAGVVAEDAEGFAAGVRVAIDPALSCIARGATSRCEPCASEGRRPCAEPEMLGVDRDGAFAELVCVPARALHRVPDSVAWEAIAMAEPLAAALGVLRAPIDRRGRGAICGTGRIADLLGRVLGAAGFSVEAWSDALRGLDWIVEANAAGGALDDAMRVLRPGGTLVLKSRPPAPVSFDLALAVRREITLVARSYGAFDEAVMWLATERVRLDDLVGEVFPIERFEDAFAAARASERRKIFFAFDERR